MNRDQIKFLAIITMTCNHIANIFLTPGTLLFEIMIDIGYFTAITMCYFLVEGYGYTHDKKKYGERLSSSGIMGEQACTGLKRYAAGCQGVRLINSGIDQKGKIWLCGTVSWVILMRQEIFSKED